MIKVRDFIDDAKDTVTGLSNFSTYTLTKKTYTVMLLLLILAVLPLPYEFYINLRFLIFVGLGIFLYKLVNTRQEQLKTYKYILIGLMVLYNPVFVIHLGSKVVWSVVSVVCLYILYDLRQKLETVDKT